MTPADSGMAAHGRGSRIASGRVVPSAQAALRASRGPHPIRGARHRSASETPPEDGASPPLPEATEGHGRRQPERPRPAPAAPMHSPAAAAGALPRPATREPAPGAPGITPLTADAGLVDRLGLRICLRRNLAPCGRAGGAVLVAAGRPDEVARDAGLLRERLGPFRILPFPPGEVEAAILAARRRQATCLAHTSLPPGEGCRPPPRRSRALAMRIAPVVAVLALLVLAPLPALSALTLATVAMLAAVTVLRLAALVQGCRSPKPPRASVPAAVPPPDRLPFVSLLVPLLREEDIAGRLVRRLSALVYPRDRLEVCLILEEGDDLTRKALHDAVLPAWMRVVEVPSGPVKTKPRALNYALELARGSVIGVYDAEDAPDPQQLLAAAAAFAQSPPDVVCVQAALDYYNPRQSVIARLFTLEYAAWFRLMLPGAQALGLALPLGGTSLFFRRWALESLGGWDAWNVTEDADLGLRLARRGWRTAMIPSTTREEAACRPVTWIRQRSRWIKGYAVTWAVHMRQPRRLWRDLGPRRFLGLQVMILGPVWQSLFAPLLWCFWGLSFGLGHPLAPWASGFWALALIGLFLTAEATALAMAMVAIRRTGHRGLWPWAPLLHPYGWLGTVAAWKAAVELVAAPFYWDKTCHGHSATPGAD